MLENRISRSINDYIQKIDSFKLNSISIVIALFLIKDKDKKFHIFDKIFLLANLNIDIILEMFFLILNNIKVNFVS